MYQKVLVAIDGSAASAAALQEAIGIAKTTGGQLKLLHVLNMLIGAEYRVAVNAETFTATLRANGAEFLENAADFARKSGVRFEQQIVESFGPPADEIVRAAETWRADLIVIGTHGRRGLKRLAMGSDAELVLRHSQCPVLIVRGKDDRGSVESAPRGSHGLRQLAFMGGAS